MNEDNIDKFQELAIALIIEKINNGETEITLNDLNGKVFTYIDGDDDYTFNILSPVRDKISDDLRKELKELSNSLA